MVHFYIIIYSYTDKIRNEEGKVISQSISSLETVELGGMEQSILIRGYDLNNPILLWLHGGPGSSQMPIAHYYDVELEKEWFTGINEVPANLILLILMKRQ